MEKEFVDEETISGITYAHNKEGVKQIIINGKVLDVRKCGVLQLLSGFNYLEYLSKEDRVAEDQKLLLFNRMHADKMHAEKIASENKVRLHKKIIGGFSVAVILTYFSVRYIGRHLKRYRR